MSDTNQPEPVPATPASEEGEEPLLKPTKKEKKARTQAQLDAFEKARLKRIENIKAKNMAKKEKEVQQYKAELPNVEEAEETEVEVEPEEKVNKVKKDKKPRKKKSKTPPPSSDDDSSSSEEEYIIRRKKPVRNKRKTKAEQEELAQAVEAEQDRYYQNIIFV